MIRVKSSCKSNLEAAIAALSYKRLTLEVDSLALNLRHNVHGDLVELEVQVLDLFSNVLDRISSGLFLKLRAGLSEQKVDFFRLAVSFFPADLPLLLGSSLQLDLT